MEFKNWLLSEMPITRFEKMGNWQPNAPFHRYDKASIGILQNDKAIEKIHKSWSNSKTEFELYFLRSPKASKFREIGQVNAEWVQMNLGVNIQPKEEAVTIIYTNNVGDEKVPLTAWIIAHRLGHVIRNEEVFREYITKNLEKDFKEILKDVYNIDVRTMEMNRQYSWYRSEYQPRPENPEKYMLALAYAIGTMKTAREWNLRNFGEFTYELVAQYIITGKVTFNPLPKSLQIDQKKAWGRPNPTTRWSPISRDEDAWEEWNEILQNHASYYENRLDYVFTSLEGKIFVM